MINVTCTIPIHDENYPVTVETLEECVIVFMEIIREDRTPVHVLAEDEDSGERWSFLVDGKNCVVERKETP